MSKISSLVLVAIVGLILRLALMPTTCHGDLLFINYLPHLLSYHGIWDGYQYFLDHHRESFLAGHFYYPPLTYVIVALHQFLLKFLMPSFGLWMDYIGKAMAGLIDTNTLTDYLTFMSRKDTFQNLFMMKSLYLIFDALGLFALIKISEKNTGRNAIIFWWMLNPILIFSSYVQGQFDIIPAFFIALSLYFLAKQKNALAIVAMVMGGAVKTIPLVLVLPLVLIIGRTWRERALYAFLAAFSYAAFFLPYILFTDGAAMNSIFPGIVGKKIGVAIPGDKAEPEKIIKSIILATAYLWGIFQLVRAKITKDHFWYFVHTSTIILLLTYSLTIVKPGYFAWITPVILLTSLKVPRVRPRYLILIIATFIYKCKKNSMCLGLFAPLDPVYFCQLQGPKDYFAAHFDYDIVIRMARMVFVVVSFWISWDLLKEIRRLKGDNA